MAVSATVKTIGAWAVAIGLILTVSYCSELPKYRFENAMVVAVKEWPAARIVSTLKTGDFFSPFSWIWPTTVQFSVAVPDPITAGYFYVSTRRYGEEPISAFLVAAHCSERELDLYGLEEPENAFPARDWLGRVVTDPDGRAYRLIETKEYPIPPEWLHAFCDTDWTAEMNAQRAAQVH